MTASSPSIPCSSAVVSGSNINVSNEALRPSQKNSRAEARPHRLGTFLVPVRSNTPRETGLPSVKAASGGWQVAQATLPSALKDVSMKRAAPREAQAFSSGGDGCGSAPLSKDGTSSPHTDTKQTRRLEDRHKACHDFLFTFAPSLSHLPKVHSSTPKRKKGKSIPNIPQRFG